MDTATVTLILTEQELAVFQRHLAENMAAQSANMALTFVQIGILRAQDYARSNDSSETVPDTQAK
jgi:hypothetical protein